MQRGYRYTLSARTGHDFDPGFRPELTPKQMLQLGVFGGKYMTDTTAEFPADWFVRRQALACEARSVAELFPGRCQPASFSLARQRLDPSGRPAGMVSMVLPLLPRPADTWRGRAPDQALEGHAAPLAQIRHGCAAGDLSCRRRQRQALLHWAYDSRKI